MHGTTNPKYIQSVSMVQCSQSESEQPSAVNKSACEDKGCKCA